MSTQRLHNDNISVSRITQYIYIRVEIEIYILEKARRAAPVGRERERERERDGGGGERESFIRAGRSCAMQKKPANSQSVKWLFGAKNDAISC